MSHHIEGEPLVGRGSQHGSLISADKVEGTAVHNASGEKLGSVDSVMIDKVSGEVAYVVMSFGGFLGIGEKYHPLPWDVLQYDTGVDGYRVHLDRGQLEGAPSYERNELDTADYSSGGDIHNYYNNGLSAREMSKDNPRRSDLNDGNSRPLGYYSTEAQSKRNADVGQTSDSDNAGTTGDNQSRDRGFGGSPGGTTGGGTMGVGNHGNDEALGQGTTPQHGRRAEQRRVADGSTKHTPGTAGFYSEEQQRARLGNRIPDGEEDAGATSYERDR